jgi:hypothetical protein
MAGVIEKRTVGDTTARRTAAAAGRNAMIKALILGACLFLAEANAGIAQEAAASGPASGAPNAAAPAPQSWQSLSPPQQQVLQGFQGRWDALPPEKQQALANGSQRWLSMTPEQRGGAEQRFKQWHALPPEQRQELRQRWHEFNSLPPEQRQRVREQYNRFRQMPPERRQELRRQWRQMSPEQRRAYIRKLPAPAGAQRNPR